MLAIILSFHVFLVIDPETNIYLWCVRNRFILVFLDFPNKMFNISVSMKVPLFRVPWGWYLAVFVCTSGTGDELVIGDNVISNGLSELLVDMNESNSNESAKSTFVLDSASCGISLSASGTTWFAVQLPRSGKFGLMFDHIILIVRSASTSVHWEHVTLKTLNGLSCFPFKGG